MLVYDDHNVEDVDTTMEDHPYDACRYGLMNVRFIGVKPGSYSLDKNKRTAQLSTDSLGLPAIDPRKLFATMD